MFYQPSQVQMRGGGNYATGIGQAAIGSFRPSEGGASQMGAQAIAGRSRERAQAFSDQTAAASSAIGYGAQLVASAQQSMTSMANTQNTNQARLKAQEKEIEYLEKSADRDRKDTNRAAKVGAIAEGVAGVADWIFNKPKPIPEVEKATWQMPPLPSFL